MIVYTRTVSRKPIHIFSRYLFTLKHNMNENHGVELYITHCNNLIKEVIGSSDARIALARQRETHSQNYTAQNTTSSLAILLSKVIQLWWHHKGEIITLLFAEHSWQLHSFMWQVPHVIHLLVKWLDISETGVWTQIRKEFFRWTVSLQASRIAVSTLEHG